MQPRKRVAIFLLLSSLVLTGQGCGSGSVPPPKPVTLTIWGVFDSQDTLQPIMVAYQAIHKNVSFDYHEVRVDTYKNDLLRAFADGTGPDIFAVHNTAMGEYRSLMAPLPPTLSIPYTEVQGTIKKETVTTVRTTATESVQQLEKDYVDVVAADAEAPYQANQKAAPVTAIWGLPLSVDTLALYYNKDLLNAAGIAQPPATWEEFQADVSKLTSVGPNNVIVQSGAAIGTSQNVERAFDIVSLLMMQNGTPMTDDRGNPTFAQHLQDNSAPGELATTFYTDFANPLKQVYTWNADQPPSFDAFVSGKTAFFFGYSYHLPEIRARAPKLHFAVTAVPQIAGSKVVNYANYWLESVSKASKNPSWAWDFIQFATGADQVKSYLAAGNKPTARRALIETQLSNPDLSVFAGQLLTAKSWYHGGDSVVTEAAFLQLIDDALGGKVKLGDAIRNAENKVLQTL
jgi:ABC-type glycerol-3-phosphate transport system substrate-binding protein